MNGQSPFIRFLRVFLLLLIVVGIALLCTTRLWVPKIVSALLGPSNENLVTVNVFPANGAVYCVNTHPGGKVFAAEKMGDGNLKFGLSLWSPEGNNIAEFGIASTSQSGWVYTKNMTASSPEARCQISINSNKNGIVVTANPTANCESDGGTNTAIESVSFPTSSYESPVTSQLDDFGTFFNHAGNCL
jgi:hypothetical protein